MTTAAKRCALADVRADLLALSAVLKMRAAEGDRLDCLELHQAGVMVANLAQGKPAIKDPLR